MKEKEARKEEEINSDLQVIYELWIMRMWIETIKWFNE